MIHESPAVGISSPSLDRLPLPKTFRISPLIRITLLLLFIALTLPLPTLATITAAPVSPSLLWAGIVLGAGLLYGGLSERVEVDALGIRVDYPRWIRWLLSRHWQLNWQDITALKPRTTGQGGIVYYFIGKTQQAYLLPMRIAGFADLLRYVEAYTAVDTRDVKPLAQPWMYVILLALSGLLFVVDGWTLWTATHGLGVS
jgi:hypothetical protein